MIVLIVFVCFRKHLAKQFNLNRAKNVILFLGDGMSIPTVTASRIHKGQKNGKSGEEDSLAFDHFPTVGLSKVLHNYLEYLYTMGIFVYFI